MRKLLTLAFLCLSTCSVFAAPLDNQYISVIDAGSSGSRIHVFQIDGVTNGIPKLTELVSIKNKIPLASAANDPTQAVAPIQALLTDASTKIGTQINHVPLYILATAGMREIPDQQQAAIYAALTSALKNNNTWQLRDAKTITGKWEGIYDWISVNDLTQQLGQPTTTGILDMGGASTEITYNDPQDAANSDDFQLVQFGNQAYRLFSHSFLGLGQDMAFASSGISNNSSCYPIDFTLKNGSKGQFNFSGCQKAIDDTLVSNQVTPVIPSHLNQNAFIGFSGFYYTSDFFKTTSSFSPQQLETAVTSVCKTPWSQLVKDYPNVAPQYLEVYCFAGTYYTSLLEHGYGFPANSHQVTIANQINNTGLDWTLGAAIYLTQNPLG
ncbi:MAG: hypothetical protein KIT27_04475 [Legionellales bacterium]|nr:hypothetical protein [Legionellales bacterium]